MLERQLSSIEVQDLTKIWDINDHRAQRVHHKVGEMLAIDCQPISMLKDVGFRQVLKSLEQCPSRKYFTETIILKIYTGMKEEVFKLINNTNTANVEGNYVSFTCDVTSLLNLTGHRIDSQFKRISAVLNAQCLTEAHTGEYITAQILTMFNKCDIALEPVHLVITDNASNMAKAMHDHLYHISGALHTLCSLSFMMDYCLKELLLTQLQYSRVLLDIFIVLLLS